MSSLREFGEEISNTEHERVENSNRRKRYKTGYNLFMQENSRSATGLPQTGETILSTNSKLIAAAWRRIDKHTKQDWNRLAQNQRKDADCGLLQAKLKCKKCEKVFSRHSDKNFHERKCGECVCVTCGAKFTDGLKLRLHEKIHKETYKCQSCNKCFVTKQALKRHGTKHSSGKPFKCNKCDQQLTTKRNLTRHMKKQHALV